jgi:hypothetical protein
VIALSKKVRDNVLSLVTKYPRLKNNYNLLVTSYWYVYDGARTFNDSAKSTSAETITRAFRRLVADDLIQVVKLVKEKRDESEKHFKKEYAND